jgi:hypothetical protein
MVRQPEVRNGAVKHDEEKQLQSLGRMWFERQFTHTWRLFLNTSAFSLTSELQLIDCNARIYMT